MEHPSRLNFSFAPERIKRLKATPEFQEIATSKKKGKARDEEIRYGKSVQEDIFSSLATWMAGHLPRPGRVSQVARIRLQGVCQDSPLLLGGDDG